MSDHIPHPWNGHGRAGDPPRAGDGTGPAEAELAGLLAPGSLDPLAANAQRDPTPGHADRLAADIRNNIAVLSALAAPKAPDSLRAKVMTAFRQERAAPAVSPDSVGFRGSREWADHEIAALAHGVPTARDEAEAVVARPADVRGNLAVLSALAAPAAPASLRPRVLDAWEQAALGQSELDRQVAAEVAALSASPAEDGSASPDQVRDNLTVLGALASPKAPDALWARIRAGIRSDAVSDVPAAESAPVPLLRLVGGDTLDSRTAGFGGSDGYAVPFPGRPGRSNWSGTMLVGLAAMAAVLAMTATATLRGLLAPPDDDVVPPDVRLATKDDRVPGPGPVSPADARPDALALLRRMGEAEARLARAGTVVVETHSPADASLPPVRREVRLRQIGADRWHAVSREAGGTGSAVVEAIRVGAQMWHGEPAADGSATGNWRAAAVDVSGRSPADGMVVAPDVLAANYDLSVKDGAPVAGRPTWQVLADPKHPGRPALRIAVDRESGLRLGSDRLDPAGRPLVSARYSEVAVVALDRDGRVPAAAGGSPVIADVSAPVNVPAGTAGTPPAQAAVDYRPERDRVRLGFAPLTVTAMPAGFREVRVTMLAAAATGRASLRTVCTDGLAVLEIHQRSAVPNGGIGRTGTGPAAANPNGKAAKSAPVTAAPEVTRRGRSIEWTESRDGVTFRLVSEDLELADLRRVAEGLLRSPAPAGTNGTVDPGRGR